METEHLTAIICENNVQFQPSFHQIYFYAVPGSID